MQNASMGSISVIKHFEDVRNTTDQVRYYGVPLGMQTTNDRQSKFRWRFHLIMAEAENKARV